MLRTNIAAAILITLGTVRVSAQAQVNKLTEQDIREGFALLYDGTRASFQANFVDYIKGNSTNTNLSSEWAVNASTGAIGILANTEDVRSKKIYKDFDLRMDYRNDANQGVFYRTLVTTDRAWQTGIEVAINNYTNENKDAPGAAYDLYPPKPNSYRLRSTNEWNQLRVVAKADSIEHWLNGVKVVGFKLHSTPFWTAYAASKWDGAKTMTFKVPNNASAGYITEGYLGLQADHGGKWEIRDFKISEKPCHGALTAPDRNSRCGFIPLDVASGMDRVAGKAVLRRVAGGLSLGLEGAALESAELISLDGTVARASLSEGAAVFSGAFRNGLYIAKVKTAAGISTRKLNLL